MINSKVMYMRTKSFLSASRLAVMVLACVFTFGFTACGGDDDGDERSIDDLLSVDTTPVSFTPGEEGIFYLFDYTQGGQLVDNHIFTVKWFKEEITVNLRRGKHRLLWVTGIHNEDSKGFDGMSWHGIHYYPENDELHWYDDEISSTHGIRYYEQDITVTDHIPTAQPIIFTRATSMVLISSTDSSPLVELPNGDERKEIGTLIVTPRIASMSLMGNGFTLLSDGFSYGVVYTGREIENAMPVGSPYITAASPLILCPKNGLSDIEVKCTVSGKDGQTITTTPLPKISLRRGYVTYMEGPLFSGKTSDWNVTLYSLDD